MIRNNKKEHTHTILFEPNSNFMASFVHCTFVLHSNRHTHKTNIKTIENQLEFLLEHAHFQLAFDNQIFDQQQHTRKKKQN